MVEFKPDHWWSRPAAILQHVRTSLAGLLIPIGLGLNLVWIGVMVWGVYRTTTFIRGFL